MDFERPGRNGEADQPEQPTHSEHAEFEKELRQAMARRPAPPSLKRRILEKRNMRHAELAHQHTAWWQRLAASILLAGVIAGGYGWRQVEDRRKGEQAAQQLMVALRITNRALKDMNRQLDHDRTRK